MSNLIASAALARKLRAGKINLHDYHRVVISSSGGKDSQVALDEVVELAMEQGYPLDRIVVVHADLGECEWDGTEDLARRQSAHYGLAFEVVSRIGQVAKQTSGIYRKGETYGSILDYARRRKAWPSSAARYCTSEFKRGPLKGFYTEVARRWRAAGNRGQCRILDVQGLRAEESKKRAGLPSFQQRISTKNQHVDTWLPIHSWTVQDVWTRIKSTGVEYHSAYDLGMPRLSCAFCIMAPKSALVLAGKHNRKLLDKYVAVEDEINHTFKNGESLREVRDAVEAGEHGAVSDEDIQCWGEM